MDDNSYYFEQIYDGGFNSFIITNNDKDMEKLKKQGYILVLGTNLPNNLNVFLRFTK